VTWFVLEGLQQVAPGASFVLIAVFCQGIAVHRMYLRRRPTLDLLVFSDRANECGGRREHEQPFRYPFQ